MSLAPPRCYSRPMNTRVCQLSRLSLGQGIPHVSVVIELDMTTARGTKPESKVGPLMDAKSRDMIHELAEGKVAMIRQSSRGLVMTATRP